MRQVRMLDQGGFFGEFSRCCAEYSHLRTAVAWVGDPAKPYPLNLLRKFSGTLEIVLGVSFEQTHPDAIDWLIKLPARVLVFREEKQLGIFHPKIYLFRNGSGYALFVGSSNLTSGGFCRNFECNCLIEDPNAPTIPQDVAEIEDLISLWQSEAYAFVPDYNWLEAYRLRYCATRNKEATQAIVSPSVYEENIPEGAWIGAADWATYAAKVRAGRGRQGEIEKVLDSAQQYLPIPWEAAYFQDIENRRIVTGIKPYWALGHIAASGRFQSLLANPHPTAHAVIVKAINAIAALEHPIPWAKLREHLQNLADLGPTMKVWSRLLCLVRPDNYCVISSERVRKNLSSLLNVPASRFAGVDGYIALLKLIHSSPWFNISQPSDAAESALWKRRSALLDVVFYEWE